MPDHHLSGDRVTRSAKAFLRVGDFPLKWIRTAGTFRGTQSKKCLPGLWGRVLQLRRKQQYH